MPDVVRGGRPLVEVGGARDIGVTSVVPIVLIVKNPVLSKLGGVGLAKVRVRV
jgi:hypothetical protein